jgi:hypothetical protein
MKKIRDLGSLPSDAFEKYQNLSSKQVRNTCLVANAFLCLAKIIYDVIKCRACVCVCSCSRSWSSATTS